MFERVLGRFSLRFDGARLTAALVLTALLGAVATAGSPSHAFAAERSDAPITDPQFLRAASEAREAAAAVLRKRASIEAVQARAYSQRAYRSLTVSDAWALVSQRFPAAASELLWQPLRLLDGERTEYMSDYVARIERPGKAPLVAYSALPLRGHGEPIDLGLQDGVGPLVPRNPIVDVAVAREASGGITLPGAGVTVRPVGLADSSVRMMNSRAFFPSVALDIDQLVLPRPLGAEFLWQVRSRDAAESIRLAVDMPAGASLRLRSETDGGLTAALPGAVARAPASVEVVRDGAVIATLLTPGTAGADGHPLQTWYELDGNHVIVRFPHRNADVEYPLLVDPPVTETWSGGDWGADGWYSENVYYGGWGFSIDRNCCGRYGLQVGAYQGGNYVQGAIGQWSWFTHPNTYLARADFVTEHFADATQIVTGIYRDGVGWEQIQVNNECPHPNRCHLPRRYFGHPNPDGADNTRAVFGLHINPGGVLQYGAFANLDEVALYLGDRHAPTVEATSHEPSSPSGWTNADVQYVGILAHDDGLGLNNAGVARTDRGNPNDGTEQPDYWLSGPVNSMCSGNRRFRCNNDFTTAGETTPPFKDGRMPYYLSRLPEGSHEIRASAHEVLGGTWGNAVFTPTWTVKIDRTKPEITQSGTLYDAAGKFVGAGTGLALHVAATDGEISPASAQRSGVVSLTVTLAGQPTTGGSRTQTCTRPEGSCPLDADITVTAAQLENLGPGTHSVVVTATDALGHVETRSWQFDYDPAPPTIRLQGSLADFDEQTLTEDAYVLRAQALDTDAEVYGAGLESLQVKLDGQTQSTSTIGCFDGENCEQARSWTWNAAAAANGPHAATVTATDKAGNQTVEEINVVLQRTADQPARSTSSARLTIQGGSAGDQAGSSVAALGDIDGDGFGDYAVGAPTATAAGRSNSGTAYLVLGRASSSTIDLANQGAGTSRILGPDANAYCGTSLAAAGDINGDGLNDLLVGCPGLDTRLGAASAQGRVYVVFGSATPQDVDLANVGSAGFAITGPTDTLNIGLPLLLARPAVFGERLQSAPRDGSGTSQDVNGDGLADIVIGDSAVSRDSQSRAGAAYVIFGKADTNPVTTAGLDAAGFAIRGPAADALAGYSAAIVDDLNGDTLADIVVGAPGAAPDTGGAAHVVYGADATSDVDLAAPAGRAVRLTSGQSQDRFGATVASLGDTDLDGRADFAIGTRDGAYVVRTKPISDQQITAQDGYHVAGPPNQPLLAAVPAAAVAAAGDVDADGRSDIAIGYPDTSVGPGRGYVVHSPEASRTLSVAALPGQRGVALTAGSANDRAGAAIAANEAQGDDPPTEAPQAIVGVPGASPSGRTAGGETYVLDDLTSSGEQSAAQGGVAAASTPSSVGCINAYNGRLTPYPFDVRRHARYGYDVELTADGRANYGESEAILPGCRRTVNKRIDRVPRGLTKLGFDYRDRPLNGIDQSNRVSWALTDSFGVAFATVRQTVRSQSGKWIATRWEIIRDSDGTVLLDSPPAGLDEKKGVSVQGYACMAETNPVSSRKDWVMIAVRPGSGGGKGARGFIKRAALKTTRVSNDALERGDTGCRSNRGLAHPLSTPGPLTNQGIAAKGLKYHGKTSANTACPGDYTNPDCGAPYDTYEPPAFPGLQIMALSTTGVTGGADAGLAGGGVALAVVRTGGRNFARLDRIGYEDPNVPCTRIPEVRWVFGNANTGRGKRGIYGWLPEIAANPQQAARQCPPPA